VGKEVVIEWTHPPTICFNMDEVTEFVRNNFSEAQFEGFSDKKFRNNKVWEWGFRKQNFEEHFTKMEEIKDKHMKLFEKHHAPIFIADVEKHKVFYNASLREFEFVRMFDPFSTFQEISMFLGNMAEPRKKIPEISDSVMLEAKGFDPKYSFRKDKKR
jgi:hypothetical protein